MNKQEIIDLPIEEFNSWILKLAKEGRFEDLKNACVIRDKEAPNRNKRYWKQAVDN